MVERCYRPGATSFEHYGGRGIGVHPLWIANFWAYHDYIEAELGEKPGDGYTIDRINNDGNYEPGNIRWATQVDQMGNTRHRAYRYDGFKIDKATQKSIGVPSEVHAAAFALSRRDGLAIYQVVARALEVYAESLNGDDQDGQQ